MSAGSKVKRMWSAPMRDIYKLAIPLGFASFLVLANTIVDTIMLGKLGAEALAGATLSIQLFFLLIVFADGVVLAFAPAYTQALGNNDRQGSAAVLRGTVLVCFGLSIVAMGIMLASAHAYAMLGIDAGISRISGHHSPIAALSVFPMLLCIVGWELASAHSKPLCVLVASILGFASNAGLNWVFIYGNLGFEPMGVKGASLATLVSILITLVTVFFFLRREIKELFSCNTDLPALTSAALKVLKIGTPIGVIEIATVGFFTSSTYLISFYGSDVLVAHVVAQQVTELAIVFMLGFGEAATIRVGLLFGTRRKVELVGLIKNLISGCVFLSVIACLILMALAVFIPKGYFGIEEGSFEQSKSLATELILIGACFTVLDALQIVLLGILRGLHDTAIPMAYVLIGYWLIGVPSGLILSHSAGLGAQGIWYGLFIGLFAVCLGLWWRLTRLMRVV
ncbi:MATE family efflux transporter [Pseudomonas koreensis]